MCDRAAVLDNLRNGCLVILVHQPGGGSDVSTQGVLRRAILVDDLHSRRTTAAMKTGVGDSIPHEHHGRWVAVRLAGSYVVKSEHSSCPAPQSPTNQPAYDAQSHKLSLCA